VHFFKTTYPYISITGGSLIAQNHVTSVAAVPVTNSIVADTTYQYRKASSGDYTPYTDSFKLAAGETYLEVCPAPAPEVKYQHGRGGDITRGSNGFVYNVTPANGYSIDQVFVNGVEQTVTNPDAFSYTFNTLYASDDTPHTMFATFSANASAPVQSWLLNVPNSIGNAQEGDVLKAAVYLPETADDVTLIFALYTADNKLLQIETKSVSSAETAVNKLQQINITLNDGQTGEADYTGCNIKVFAWNDLASAAPITPSALSD
jgi:hypothetical protein